MKKIINYVTAVVMVAVCAFGFSACGDDDNNNSNTPANLYGDWVTILQFPSYLLVETDNFAASNVNAVVYQIDGTNLLNGTSLREDNVTNITKITKKGTYTYQDKKLTVTYSDLVATGTLVFLDNQTLNWVTDNGTLEMIRPNTSTINFVSQVERLYQSKFALGTYTIGLTVSDKGTLSDLEYNTMNSALKSMEQSFRNTTESRARAAFEESFKAIDTSKLSTEKDYTLEYFLKNSSGTKIATHNIIIKNGNVTLK